MKQKGNDASSREANLYLGEIRKLTMSISGIEAEATAELARVSGDYEKRLSPLKTRLQELDKRLIKLMKADKKTFFKETDVVILENGTLVHSKEDRVKIPRGALVKCKELGILEVIKTGESLDRDAVERWPDERLLLIGAERRLDEKFSYDVRIEEKR